MKVLIIVFCLFLLASCKDNSSPTSVVVTTSTLENPFKGNWTFTITAISTPPYNYSGGGTVTIRSDGSFSSNISISQNNGTPYTTTLSGNVENNGQVVNGKMFSSDGNPIGDVTGVFVNNSGSGYWRYQIYSLTSSWTSVKQ